MKTYVVNESPVGAYTIGYDGDVIVSVHFGAAEKSAPSPVALEAERQLAQYFAGERKTFDLPIRMDGTEFQRKVWRALCDIPYGEVRTYGDIARAVGNPRACRAIGGANHKNPICIIVPCHRVVAANGIGGYGEGIEIKKYLLELEGGLS
ncbi:MAG: methylated-DNA--[Clostridia bacterium]|nr:methylated-DNA--[protein]-cysteine S-methyltransferase [Clostridia bacterium]